MNAIEVVVAVYLR